MRPIAGESELGGGYEFVPKSIEKPNEVHGSIQFTQPFQPDEYDVPSFLEVHAQDWEAGVLQVALTAGEKHKTAFSL